MSPIEAQLSGCWAFLALSLGLDLLDLFYTVPLFRIFCRAASWIYAASTNHFLSREKGLLSVSDGENVMVFPGNRQVVVQQTGPALNTN